MIVSDLSNATTITPSSLLFSDGFETGNLSQWTEVSGLVVQQQQVYAGQYAVRGTSSGTPTYAYRQLVNERNELYYRLWFNIISQDINSVYLQRFRTSSNGAIMGVFVSSTGKLGYRNDVTGLSTTSSTIVTPGTWHELQVHILINGAAGETEIWLDGTRIDALSNTENLGNTLIGRVQLGETSSGRTYDVAIDQVAVSINFISGLLLDILPLSLDFGDQLNWVKSDPQTVIVTNNTGVNVHIGTLRRSSGKYLLGDNTCGGATLAADASCTFEVIFRPTSTGVVNATITIPSDVPGAPHTVSLTGNGVGGTQLMTNNSFELDSNGDGLPNVWQSYGLTSPTDGINTQFAKSGTRSIKLEGQGVKKTLKEVINHTGSANDDFLFVLWSKAQNVPAGWFYRTQVSFYKGNSLVHRRIKDYTPGTHDWEYRWVPITVPGAYDRIEFEIIYKRPSGTVWFDSASLKWAQ